MAKIPWNSFCVSPKRTSKLPSTAKFSFAHWPSYISSAAAKSINAAFAADAGQDVIYDKRWYVYAYRFAAIIYSITIPLYQESRRGRGKGDLGLPQRIFSHVINSGSLGSEREAEIFVKHIFWYAYLFYQKKSDLAIL